MFDEFDYLRSSRRWTARLFRAGLLTTVLAVPVLLALAWAMSGQRYLADFSWPARLWLVGGPIVLALFLRFQGELKFELGEWFFALSLVWLACCANLAIVQRAVYLSPAWNPTDFAGFIARSSGATDLADLSHYPSPKKSEIIPLLKDLPYLDYDGYLLLMPWLLQNADAEVLDEILADPDPLNPSDLAIDVICRKQPSLHEKVGAACLAGFHYYYLTPTRHWSKEAQLVHWTEQLESILAPNGLDSFFFREDLAAYSHPDVLKQIEADLTEHFSKIDKEFLDGVQLYFSPRDEDFLQKLMKLPRNQRIQAIAVLARDPHWHEHIIGHPELVAAIWRALPPAVLLQGIEDDPSQFDLEQPDVLLTQISGKDYAELVRRVSRAEVGPWLDIRYCYASARSEVYQSLAGSQFPPDREGVIHGLRSQHDIESAIAYLKLWDAQESPDLQAALDLLEGRISRADAYDLLEGVWEETPLAVALQMRIGKKKLARIKRQGSIECGFRKRESVYLSLLFIALAITARMSRRPS